MMHKFNVGGAAKLSRKEADRSAAFRLFNQMLVNDSQTNYIYECAKAGEVSAAVRFLFFAIYECYGPYSRPDLKDNLKDGIRDCALNLQKKLLNAGVAKSREDAQSIAADIMQRAKHWVVEEKNKVAQLAIERAHAERYRATLAKDAISLGIPPDPGLSAFLGDIKTLDAATTLHKARLKRLWEAFDAETHTVTKLEIAAGLLSDKPIAIDKALGLVGRMVREDYQSFYASRKARVADLSELFDVETPPLLGHLPKGVVSDAFIEKAEIDAKQAIRDTGALSSLVALVLLDVQKQLAARATLEILRNDTTAGRKPHTLVHAKALSRQVEKELSLLNDFADGMVSEGKLSKSDRASLKQNATTMTVQAQEFFALGAGRGIER